MTSPLRPGVCCCGIARALCSVLTIARSPREEESPSGAPPMEPNSEDIQTNWDEAIETFDAMDLREDLLRGIYAYGFEKPSAIQQRAIKPLMMNRDTIAQAQSGTGKTATFTIGARRLCARARRRAPDARRDADADAAASSPPQASSRTSTRRSRTARR